MQVVGNTRRHHPQVFEISQEYLWGYSIGNPLISTRISLLSNRSPMHQLVVQS